jgi:hypothetical protein
MAIHQIQIAHDETEDRLLLRLSTTDDCEFRFWLTRRFTRRLWTMLVQMLEWDRAVKQQADRETRHAVLDIQHQGYSQEADYSTQFREATPDTPRRLPLGADPVLLAKAQGTKRDDGIQVLKLLPLQGTGIDITVDTRLLHLFMRLLREQVAKVEWDLELALHQTPQGQEPQRRVLN